MRERVDPTAEALRCAARMVQRIVAKFDPDKVILFGSYARGTAGPDSDIDLLVVMPFVGSKRAKMIELLNALGRFRFPKDVIVATPDEVERRRDMPGAVIRSALEEGQVLYERR